MCSNQVLLQEEGLASVCCQYPHLLCQRPHTLTLGSLGVLLTFFPLYYWSIEILCSWGLLSTHINDMVRNVWHMHGPSHSTFLQPLHFGTGYFSRFFSLRVPTRKQIISHYNSPEDCQTFSILAEKWGAHSKGKTFLVVSLEYWISPWKSTSWKEEGLLILYVRKRILWNFGHLSYFMTFKKNLKLRKKPFLLPSEYFLQWKTIVWCLNFFIRFYFERQIKKKRFFC